MINKINLLKNVGTFDYVESRPDTDFRKLTLIYGENGKGKTTLANIFCSLGSNNPSLIEERQRLGTKDRPHIVIEEENQTLVYQDGQWKSHLPNIAVFDDNFVVQNVCSGMEVSSDHRKNLHGLIIGEEGVTLNFDIQVNLAKDKEQHKTIKTKKDAVQDSINGDMSVDIFCGLKENPDIENAISDIKKSIKTVESKDVKNKNGFQTIELPALDIGVINGILQKDLPDLEQDAESMVKAHFLKLGVGAQGWVSDGANKFEPIYSEKDDEICPFCAQSLENSTLISHYKDYFSSAYNNLKAEINTLGIKTKAEHDDTILVAFGQAVSAIKEATVFWKEHINISDVDVATIDGINAVEIVRVWKNAIESILDILRKKASAPLEKIDLPAEVIAVVAEYEKYRQWAVNFSKYLQACNVQIDNKKKEIGQVNLQDLKDNLDKLQFTRDRYTESVNAKCKAYLDAKEAKKITEAHLKNAQEKLTEYSKNIFKNYQNAINSYLDKFLAGFHLTDMAVTNPGGAKSCIYALEILNIPVPVNAANGEPSFKNTLSAGDRNALALAFFFASLDKDVALAEKIVVIDDPMTSLDEHRANRTVQEIRSLTTKVNQVILLSHSKSFLCQIWEEADRVIKDTPKISLHISRAQESSVIEPWNIHDDCITQNDKRHTMIAEYIEAQILDKQRDVAIALRPTLEAFMRVAYPERFPPGAFLGVFITQCRQGISNNTLILDENDISELDSLINYANKFHHDSNPNHRTEIINDIELVACCKKVLSFTRRPI